MKIVQKLLIALCIGLPLGLIMTDVAAQQYYNMSNAPRIDGFNVDEVSSLRPGTELNFTVYGTPGANVTLGIAGAQRILSLSEREAGQYEGSYTISNRDSITARSAVTANLRKGNQVASRILSESLQAGVGYHDSNQMNGAYPKIVSFGVEPGAHQKRENDLEFTLYGTPGARAEIMIDGVKGKVLLREVSSGKYSGVYNLKRRDRITPNSTVTAQLRIGERVTTATLDKGLFAKAYSTPQVSNVCSNCGVVETVNAVEIQGDGGYLGTLGGGVVGALLGNQVGGGNGKTAATIAGAIGGALAGRAIEGNSKKTLQYEALVRLQNGAAQTVSLPADHGYRVGDKVRITDAGLVPGW
ncbi:MAG: glycine zipper 2TM domain-containing protein [Gallionella sp.]